MMIKPLEFVNTNMKAIDTSEKAKELSEKLDSSIQREIEWLLGEGVALKDFQLAFCKDPFRVELRCKGKVAATIRPIIKEPQ